MLATPDSASALPAAGAAAASAAAAAGSAAPTAEGIELGGAAGAFSFSFSERDFFDRFSPTLRSFFFLGSSHAHAGINESTWCERCASWAGHHATSCTPVLLLPLHSPRSFLGPSSSATSATSATSTCAGTHKANILEQIWEDPDSLRHGNLGDAPQDQADNSDDDEQANKTQRTDRQVPHADTQLNGPEREHDTSKHDGDHGDTADNVPERRAVVEPRVVACGVELLLRGEVERLGHAARDGRVGVDAVNAEEEGAGVSTRLTERGCGGRRRGKNKLEKGGRCDGGK